MCQANDKIKFCTCNDTELSDSTHPYKWKLTQVISPGRLVIGKFVLPVKEITKNLDEEKILHCLNSNENCFDFDYNPSDNDKLKIMSNPKNENYRFIQFVFKNGKWKTEAFHPRVHTVEKLIGQGVLIF